MELEKLLKVVDYITAETICTGNTVTRFENLCNNINRAAGSLDFCRKMQHRNPDKYAAIIPEKETAYNNTVAALSADIREYCATRPNIATIITNILTA